MTVASALNQVKRVFVDRVYEDPKVKRALPPRSGLDNYRQTQTFAEILATLFNFYGGDLGLISKRHDISETSFHNWCSEYGVEIRVVSLLSGETVEIHRRGGNSPYFSSPDHPKYRVPRRLREVDNHILVPKYGDQIDLPQRVILFLNDTPDKSVAAELLGTTVDGLYYWLNSLDVIATLMPKREYIKYLADLKNRK